MFWRLALVQLFFTLGWTVYVIFLPGLFRQAGIDAAWLPWVLIADQLLFAIADVVTGVWLDRSNQLMRQAGNWLTALVLASCAVFMLLPWIAQSAQSWVLLAAVFVWVICSSVLRVPPLVLLAKAVTPQQSGGHMAMPVAAYLFGIGVAGAVAPYLTVLLKNRDPLLPFMMASVALAVTTLFLRQHFITQSATISASAPSPRTSPANPTNPLPLLFSVALFAFGMQVHAAINSAKLFAIAAPGLSLEWLMPLYWAGFSVAMFPASRWLARRSDHTGNVHAAASRAMWLAGLAGGMALVACALNPPLPLLVALQIVAGAAWAVLFLAAIEAATCLGRTGREGGWIGVTLALIALATAGRIILVLAMSGDNMLRAMAAQLPWLAAVLWMVAAAVVWFAGRGWAFSATKTT